MRCWAVAALVIGCGGSPDQGASLLPYRPPVGLPPSPQEFSLPELSEQPSLCRPRAGTYVTEYIVRGGNCGPLSETVETITEEPLAPTDPCTGSISYSENHCEVTTNITCVTGAEGSRTMVTNDGKTIWDEAGQMGLGILELIQAEETPVIAPPGVDVAPIVRECRGTYNVVSTRF
jgi:hypothetical protein